MTNTDLLGKKIKESGLMKKFIAEQLKITPNGLTAKLQGRRDFKSKEILVMCDLLHITDLQEKDDIFFMR